MTIGLSEKQQDVLEHIRAHKNWYGHTPTLQQVTKAFKWSSLNSAEQHISALCAKGYLRREGHALMVLKPDFCDHCGGRS